MFHKIAAGRFTDGLKTKLWFWIACALWTACACLAQEPASGQMEIPQKKSKILAEDQNQPDEQGPMPVPIKEDEVTRSIGMQTFVDDDFLNMQNRWGFSLNAYQAYTTNIGLNSQTRQGSRITSFIPRTFLNLGRRTSMFHIDLGAGYRIYNKQNRGLNSWDYYGDVLFSHEFSKRTDFHLSNQFTSSYNDSWSFVSLYSPIRYDPSFTNEVIFNRQKITRNSLRAQFNYQPASWVRLGVFGGYNSYRYSINTLGNEDALEAGGELDFRLTKWLTLTNSYSTYLNYVDERFRDARIHQLQVGGLNFHLTRSWRIWLSGGVDMSDYQEETRFGERVHAGIGYTSRNTALGLTYQHGFTSAIGISRLMKTDLETAFFGHQVNSWMRVSLQSYYYDNSELSSGGRLKTFSGGGILEFKLRRDLVATLGSHYQNQTARNFSVQGLGISRFTANVGLQYVWPSRRQTDYDHQIWGIR